MLETIDEVPWRRLTHAYGAAVDVPGQIRALLDPEAKVRKKALWELYGNIFHQGTRYQATPHAVPFLEELLRSPETPDRAEIVHLMVSLALGYEEEYLPEGFDPGAFRRREAEYLVQLSEEERARCSKFGFGPQVELDCYEAVARCVPTFLHLLEEQDLLEKQDLLEEEAASLRRASIHALAWFPEQRGVSIPVLRRLLDQNPDADADRG